MNLLVLAAVGGGGLLALWLVQTAALWAVGAPRVLAWPLRHGSESAAVRWALKAALQGVLAALLLLPPWLAGETPWAYLRERFPPVDWDLPLRTAGLTLLLFGGVLLFNVRVGWVTLAAHKRWPAVLKKVLRASLTPVPLALMEELVFRGVVLEQLARTLPTAVALTASAALFAAVHFLRPQKRVLLPALGLFSLGLTLGVVYLATGHALWLPIAFHAAGVWYIQATRPFTTYRGPAWLIGYRSYPICGAFGLAVLWLLAVWACLGARGAPEHAAAPESAARARTSLLAPRTPGPCAALAAVSSSSTSILRAPCRPSCGPSTGRWRWPAWGR